MTNKLKDIFSNKQFDFGGNIKFKDNESYKRFYEALKDVKENGNEIKIKGATELSTKVKHGKKEYPLLEQVKLDELTIAPSKEKIPLKVKTKSGNKTVLFNKYETKENIILENDTKEVVYFKIEMKRNMLDIKFFYRLEPKAAKTIKDIVDSLDTAIETLNTLFVYEDNKEVRENNPIYKAQEAFYQSKSFFEKLYSLEKKLGLKFTSKKVNDSNEDMINLEEIYLLLIKKEAIRLDGNLNQMKSKGLEIEPNKFLKIGQKIDLTFISKLKYEIYGCDIDITTVNVLFNSKIKSIKEIGDGTTEVLYDGTDNVPMYMSCKGFRTDEEAHEAKDKAINEDKDQYEFALTLNEHIQATNDEDKS